MPALIIGNAPCEIRGISLKSGRTSRTGTGPCQTQNPFDRQTYRAESFYSFHPWFVLCSVEEPLQPLSSLRALHKKRDIYKYFATKNSFAPQMLSIPSRVPADSRFPSFLLSRDIRRRAATLTFASPRTHRSGNSRENRLCLSEFDFAFGPCNEFRNIFHTLVKIIFKYR